MDWGLALSVTATGLTVVFAVLIILVLVVMLFGKIMDSTTEKRSKPASDSASVSSKPIVAENTGSQNNRPIIESGISEEVVAAISAALTVMMSAEGKTYQLKSIKQTGKVRPAWSTAGIQDNTRPF